MKTNIEFFEKAKKYTSNLYSLLKSKFKKIMSFKEIFKNENDYNEKTIIGAISFFVMVLFALTNLIMGIAGNEFHVNNEVYYSFVIVTLGSFSVDGISKINKKS